MHLPEQISDLATILGVAAIVTFVFQKIRQPVVLGYIIAGVIVGPHTPTGISVSDLPNVQVWAELGVIFLMFALGLEFTFHKLARVGVTAAGTASVEVLLMMAIGFGAGRLLGWSNIDSLFLGGILSISSTTIIIKAFDELGVKGRRFAEIVFGVLIVEDLAAILLLVAFSTIGTSSSFSGLQLVFTALKLVLIVGSWFLIGYFLIPAFLRYAGKYLYNETLTILSIALCLLLVVLATHFDYSAALGAFIMGSILAETSESHRIETLMHPLRDLFAAVFFVSVGMLVDPRVLWEHAGAIAFITVITIVGKVISSGAGALLTGQPLKRSIQIGFSLAQIGEFSFIIATLGATLKVTSDFLYPIAVTVSVITTFTTPYLIRFSGDLAEALEKRLPDALNKKIGNYVAWTQTPARRPATPGQRRQFVQFFLSGLVVSLIFFGMLEFGLPWVRTTFGNNNGSDALAGVVSVFVSAPFVWGMFFAFRTRASLTQVGLASFLSQLATIVWVGILSSAFFPTGASLLLTLFAAAVLFFFLYRRLERSYQWFERRFLSNLKAHGGSETADLAPQALAPWDLHAVRLTVHQNSAMAGKAIKDLQIRSHFGLNIVAIQRGLRVLASPSADECLFPKDELMVLGTEEQIDAFRTQVESPSGDTGDGKPLSEYFLRRVLVEKPSDLIGQSIRDSGLRVLLKGLIVGLERGSLRTINPDPSTVLQSGDLLWVVTAPS